MLEVEPGWLRHNWFGGYMEFQDGKYEEALALFQPLIESRSDYFPVEGLNARIVAIDALVRLGRVQDALAASDEALAFFAAVRDDFEVKINFRIEPWLAQAKRSLETGEYAAVRSYRFAC